MIRDFLHRSDVPFEWIELTSDDDAFTEAATPHTDADRGPLTHRPFFKELVQECAAESCRSRVPRQFLVAQFDLFDNPYRPSRACFERITAASLIGPLRAFVFPSWIQ